MNAEQATKLILELRHVVSELDWIGSQMCIVICILVLFYMITRLFRRGD